ncbi:ribosome small subunit-dependent GTPase A [Hydrogenophaga sp. 5NK40-0174]|uniref:ribosome small subunit-dependent GTPase A n=1 Tax=Hydrogenophaga sp. 5NK40-0174 TaxID=3127649 RepID=UPI003105AE0E
MSSAHTQEGLVVGSHGRHCLVESADGTRRICHAKGKKNQTVVGDRVSWLASADEGRIETVLPRRNLMYRQDEMRTKSFAANIDQVLVLLGAEPEFSERQLARALIAAEAEGIDVAVALNKQDVQPAFDRAWQRLSPYRSMGYAVMPLAMKPDSGEAPAGAAELKNWLSGKTTLVLGPSGAGKSTLVNHCVPHAQAQTGEISRALNSGKHTTTSTTWYWLDDEHKAALIDSPGFQEFGLRHIEPMDLPRWMPDLRAHLGECRFHNCTHLHEPGCGVREHVAEDGESAASPNGLAQQAIHPNRYQIYAELFAELTEPPRY